MTYRFNSVPGSNGSYIPQHATFFVVNSDTEIKEFSVKIVNFRESADRSGAIEIALGLLWSVLAAGWYLLY